MKTFEKLVEEAEEALTETGATTAETPRFKGIGLAILALAQAIHEKN